MSSEVSLYINNTNVPLSEDAGLRISKQLSDCREPEKRGAAFTKTLKVPGSKEVNILFGHIFDIKHRIQGSSTATTNFGPDFNPNLKASALITVDGIEAIRGYARLLDIILQGDQIVYEVTVASESKDLFQKLEGKLMREVDFTDLNHEINRTNISNSWATSYIRTGTPQTFAYGDGYTYPLIDQGGNTLSKKFLIEDLYPALALREIMVKLFAEAGYTWSSDSFFEDTIFKHLYLPYPGGGMSLTEADLIAREWKATRITTNQTIAYGATLIMQDDSTGSNFDSAAAYNNATGEWIVPVTGKYAISMDLSATVTFTTGKYASPLFIIEQNGKQVQTMTGRGFFGSTTPQTVDIQSQTVAVHLDAGSTVKVKFYGFMDYAFAQISEATVTTFTITKDVSYMQVEALDSAHAAGETLDFTDFFPEPITQREFLLDVFKCFNLWVATDPDQDKRLIIKPRNTFFTNTVLDWTNKIDVGSEIKVTPLGELQDKRYSFQFKPGEDYANQLYQQQYGKIYGGYTYTVNNDFVTSTREIKVAFEPTPFINYGAAWDAILPHIEYADGKKGAGLRLLYFAGLKKCATWEIYDSTVSGAGSTTYITYPFMGHLDSPTTPTLDLNWGMPREVAIDLKPGSAYTNGNLFNTYWRQQIEETTDPDAKIYTAKFRLTPADWQQLTMRETVYVSGEYFRINVLQDWDPVNDGLTTVELIKRKTAPSFSPTTGRGGRGYDVLDPNGDQFPKTKTGNGTAAGNKFPGSGSGAQIGGTGNEATYPGTTVVGGKGNKVLAPDVMVINSSYCTIEPGGMGCVLIDCSSMTITEPGLYFKNKKLSQNFLEGGLQQVMTATGGVNSNTDLIIVSTGGGAVTAQLPAVSGAAGRRVTLIKSGANVATVEAIDGAQIEGVTSFTLADRITLETDGADWHIITKDPGTFTYTLSGTYNCSIDGGTFGGESATITY